jgi:hypothetical protein
MAEVPSFSFKISSPFQVRDSSRVSDEPMPVSPEFDGRYAKRAPSQYDRSYWEVELLRRHPQIRDLIERTDPVVRAASFAALYLPDRRLQPNEAILSLISQHLKLLGLTRTAAALDDSFVFPIVHSQHHPFSQLLHHLERAVVNADRF